VEALKEAVGALKMEQSESRLMAQHSERSMDAVKEQLADTQRKLEASKEAESALKSECFESRRRMDDAKESANALRSELAVTRRELEASNEALKALKLSLSETRLKLHQSQSMSCSANTAAAAAPAAPPMDEEKGPLYESAERDVNPYLTLYFGAPAASSSSTTGSHGETDPLRAFVSSLESKANDEAVQFGVRSQAAHWSVEEVAWWLTTIGMQKYLGHFIEQFVDGQILLHDLSALNLVSDLKVKPLHSPKIMRSIAALKAYCAPPAPGTPDPRRLRLVMVEAVTRCHLDGDGTLSVVRPLEERIAGLLIENEAKSKFIEKLQRRIARRTATIDQLNDAVDRLSERSLPHLPSSGPPAPASCGPSPPLTASKAAVVAEPESMRRHRLDSAESAQSDDRYKMSAQNGRRRSVVVHDDDDDDDEETECKVAVTADDEEEEEVEAEEDADRDIDSEDDMDSLFAAVWRHAEDEDEGTEEGTGSATTSTTGFVGKIYHKLVGRGTPSVTLRKSQSAAPLPLEQRIESRPPMLSQHTVPILGVHSEAVLDDEPHFPYFKPPEMESKEEPTPSGPPPNALDAASNAVQSAAKPARRGSVSSSKGMASANGQTPGSTPFGGGVLREIEGILDEVDLDEDGFLDRHQFVDFLSEWTLHQKYSDGDIDAIFEQLVDGDHDGEAASCRLFMERLPSVLEKHPKYDARKAVYRVCQRLLKAAKQ